ncbi:hypothetical protein GCM10010193_36590 [Kitasatospora atroaurantiaca]|uniref:glutathionylspermidine synthase family protein n=1 Tax=Kitasatospora atroaurantiaca TaxID=285545 RepID=UPI0033856585
MTQSPAEPAELRRSGFVALGMVGTLALALTSCSSQQLHPLPDFDGNRTALGTWVVDGEAAGLGIRETDDSPITLPQPSAGGTPMGARFLPHIIA